MKKYIPHVMGAVFVLVIIGAWALVAKITRSVTETERITTTTTTSTTTTMDLNQFTWTREPKACVITDGRVEVTTNPHTDLWQRTYYHFRNDNAPVLQMETEEKFFSFIVKTDFSGSHTRFDQCGVVMYLDSENWLKGSVEYENTEFQHLGSVATNHGYSDWATTAIPADVKQMWYRLSRREDDFCIECSQDGEAWSQMRVCHMYEAQDTVRFGIYACSPEESSFTAVFTDMQLTECAWKAHDGQQPDDSPIVTIETSMGEIVVELFNETPLHRDNFLRLVDEHVYDSLLFHRVISGFMIQAGDTQSKHAAPGVLLGDSDLPYQVPAEIRVDQGIVHHRGVLAAAREGDATNPERASSSTQFYITQADVHRLDGKYTVFGRVLRGMEVVDAIAGVATDRNDRPLEDVRILSISYVRPCPLPEW